MCANWIENGYIKGFDPSQGREYELNIPDDFKYVINVAVPMDYEHMKYSPAITGGAAVGLGYSKMAFTVGLTTQFLLQSGLSYTGGDECR